MNTQEIADCVAQARANIAEAGPLMSEAARMIERQRDVIARLVALIDETRDDSEGRYPSLDSGCIECTQGATPNKYNTGPCAYHAALRLLDGKKDTSKRITPKLRLECLMQAGLNEDRASLCAKDQPALRAVFEANAALFREVAK